MKRKSEEHLDNANKEENDLKALGHLNKAFREGRLETFEDDWLPKFEEVLGPDIQYNPKTYAYTIRWRENKVGNVLMIDFYPKANKLLIRNKNKWIKPGLKWLINNIINN